MATKTAKKATSTKRATSSAARKATSSTSKLSAKDLLLVKKSERHYVIFYVIFALATLIFAGLTVYLFVRASDLETKYEELTSCLTSDKNCSVYVKKADDTDKTEYYTDDTVVDNAEEAAR